MRIAIGQLWQESNTLNPLPTTRQHFEEFGVLRGSELIERMADTNELGGFIQSLRSWSQQPEILGLARLPAWPGGAATADTFAWLKDVLLHELRRNMPADGVLLALHGALVADGHPDVEGAVLQAIRHQIGTDIPLVATLDLHANITPLMVRAADALVLYHTAPHIDVFETGQRGARMLQRILIDGARPVTAFQKLPMVVPAERANTQDPTSISHRFRRRLQDMEQESKILSTGLATVQPWLDIPELGSSVLVLSDGDPELAQSRCAELAAEVWNHRRDYLPELTPLADAVRQAHEIAGGLVVLSDSADSTTSGAPGDSTWVLRELSHYHWPGPALVTLVSPEVVAQAQGLGIGKEITTSLGGFRDCRFSQPVRVTARVTNLFHAGFIMSGHLAKNLAIDMGPSAVLQTGNVFIILTSRSGPHFAPELFQSAGIDPFAAQVLVAKSPCGFRAAYAERARKIMVVKAPGCAPSDFWNYPYHHIPRPLWPWEQIESWKPVPELISSGKWSASKC
jgi:microcystin degradation protein MlrC